MCSKSIPLSQFRIVGETVEISLSKGKVAVVDLSDYEFVRQYRWHLGGTGRYVARTVRHGVQSLLHRDLLGAAPGIQVDHVNHDGLDNRRCNIRLATPSQNKAHHRQRRGATGFVGVYEDKRRGTFTARIGNDNRRIGAFTTAEEAARARDAAAIERWGAFAVLNFPDEYLNSQRQEQR